MEDKIDIKNFILEKIKTGNIKKIPRLVFGLKGLLFALAGLAVFILILYFISFLLFAMQSSGLMHLSSLGFKGFELLFVNFPWILLILVVVLILVLEILVNKYSFSYKRPLIYSFLAIIIIALSLGFLVWKLSFQEKIYQNFKNDTFIKTFYDKYITPSPDIFHPGTVLKLTKNGLVLEGREKFGVNVKISENTQMPKDFKIYKGGKILVIGKVVDGVIFAEAIDNAPVTGRP